jgi:hypothetical protein
MTAADEPVNPITTADDEITMQSQIDEKHAHGDEDNIDDYYC